MLSDFVNKSGEPQSVWAARLGVDKGHFSRLCAGRQRPSLDLAVRIERLTGGAVPASSWIAEQTEEEPAP